MLKSVIAYNKGSILVGIGLGLLSLYLIDKKNSHQKKIHQKLKKLIERESYPIEFQKYLTAGCYAVPMLQKSKKIENQIFDLSAQEISAVQAELGKMQYTFNASLNRLTFQVLDYHNYDIEVYRRLTSKSAKKAKKQVSRDQEGTNAGDTDPDGEELLWLTSKNQLKIPKIFSSKKFIFDVQKQSTIKQLESMVNLVQRYLIRGDLASTEDNPSFKIDFQTLIESRSQRTVNVLKSRPELEGDWYRWRKHPLSYYHNAFERILRENADFKLELFRFIESAARSLREILDELERDGTVKKGAVVQELIEKAKNELMSFGATLEG